jgi:hypothetical protein
MYNILLQQLKMSVSSKNVSALYYDSTIIKLSFDS